MFMSGRLDGTTVDLEQSTHGTTKNGMWSLSIGLKEDNDLVLKYDTFVSRRHALLHFNRGYWNLEDCQSTNGTFVEHPQELFSDKPVTSVVTLLPGQLFRVGRTWLRIQSVSDDHDLTY